MQGAGPILALSVATSDVLVERPARAKAVSLKTFRPVSTSELRRRLADPALAIIDSRSLAAYNGWRLPGEARGGHIPDAIAFPSSWLSRLDEASEIDELLSRKGVVSGQEIVLYGNHDPSESALATALAERGHTVRTYAHDFATWASVKRRPVERLARYEKLVPPQWLEQVLAGARPEAAPNGRFALFHVNFGVPDEYEESHLPQAFYLDTNWLENPLDWNRRSPDELAEAMRVLGITTDTTVVLYGRDTEGDANEKWPGRRAGQIAAARAALILRYCGVEDVRLLDGGFDAWVQAGLPLETKIRRTTPAASFGATIPVRPEVIVDIAEAKTILSDPERAALVSVRTWNEHIGKVSGYNYISAAGRITGDVWGNCGSDAYHMQHYRNVDNTMRAYTEIAANWASAAITPDKWVAFYCGTGWRASETWFYAYLMGWRRVAVYDGGWFEWSKDPHTNPIEVDVDAAGEEVAA
jgi:thiosulfate/3-mercaptopyruvate sulfurtransferase